MPRVHAARGEKHEIIQLKKMKLEDYYEKKHKMQFMGSSEAHLKSYSSVNQTVTTCPLASINRKIVIIVFPFAAAALESFTCFECSRLCECSKSAHKMNPSLAGFVHH